MGHGCRGHRVSGCQEERPPSPYHRERSEPTPITTSVASNHRDRREQSPRTRGLHAGIAGGSALRAVAGIPVNECPQAGIVHVVQAKLHAPG
jgi:hypothetical protein